MPFGMEKYHEDQKILHIGCEKPHAYFIPYETKDGALCDVRDSSFYFKTLIGEWSFKFFPSQDLIEDPMKVTFAEGADPAAVMPEVLKVCRKVERDVEIAF